MKDHEIDEQLHDLNQAEILVYKDIISHCEAKIKLLTINMQVKNLEDDYPNYDQAAFTDPWENSV
jgi:hypothetical protein